MGFLLTRVNVIIRDDDADDLITEPDSKEESAKSLGVARMHSRFSFAESVLG